MAKKKKKKPVPEFEAWRELLADVGDSDSAQLLEALRLIFVKLCEIETALQRRADEEIS